MADLKPQYANVTTYDTFPKLVVYNARRWPDEVAMREKEFGIWNEYTWADYLANVRLMALGLETLGIGEGDTVALIGDNRPAWVWGEIAAHALRGMSLGMYQDSLGEEVSYLLTYAEARVVIAEDEEQVDKLLDLGDTIPTVRHIVYCDPRGMRKYDDPRLVSLDALREAGAGVHAREPDRFEKLVAAGHGEDVAVLCTTSGTTAKPKLAMMQAGRLLDHSISYLAEDPKYPSDNYVSVLPLPWIMEQTYAVAQSLISRITVNFVEEPETQMADLREIGPTFVLLAPRVWESIAADVRARMMDADRFKRMMFRIGMDRGRAALEAGTRSKLADFILFRALRDRLGFRYLRSAATGGAALGPETFRFFQAMGVPLRQLYGQTELAGAYTIHREHDVDFDTVGVPFSNSEIRIENPDPEGVGEIVARTGGMFSGYFRNEDATKADVRDGWMHTGDAGYIKPENQHLVVIDRVKDLAQTDTGVSFSPQYIENKLKFSPFIAEAVILGRDRPYLAAMICIRFSIMSKWAEQRAIAFTNYTNLAAHPEVYKLIKGEIEQVNTTLPAGQQIRKFLLLYKELDADDGELTRTRKVRRGVIAEKYGDIIDAIYSDRPSVDVDTVITFQDGSTSRIQTTLQVADLHGGAPHGRSGTSTPAAAE